MLKLLFILLLILLGIAHDNYAQNLSDLELQIENALEKNDTTAIAIAWYNLGKYYDNENDPGNSNKALKIALFWSQSNNNHKAVSSIANYLASNYSIESKSDSAVYFYNIAIEECIASSDSLKLAAILINLGDEYATRGNYVEAANYALLSIKIKESLNDSANLAYYYQKVGEIYKVAGENEKWEEYLKKAYQLIDCEKCAGISAVAAIYNDMGGIEEGKGNYKQALLYYDTLIFIGKENNYDKAIGVALSNSATIHKLLGNIEKAIETAIEARKYRDMSVYQRIYDNNLLAELYLANNNLTEARRFASLTISDSLLHNFPDEKMRALKINYLVEKQSSNFEKALYWNEIYKQLSDSIRDKEIRTRIVDMEMAYQTEKKEQQIALLTTENELKNQRLKAGIVLLTVLLIVIVMILYILRIKRKQSNLIQNDLQQQVLRSQMNPHFIFNVLGSIQNFLLTNDNKKAAKYLSQFASLTRATLEYSASETISLTNEIKMLKNFMELEKMRKPDKFDFSITTDENIESDFIHIPPMMIQPFIENSIKHGFSEIDYPGMLILKINENKDCIEFTIEDNGKGLNTKSSTSGHHSMAMHIFEKRRKLIQQKHKKEFKFEIKNLKDTDALKSGVLIFIKIPVLNND